jgi:hypothetical protein
MNKSEHYKGLVSWVAAYQQYRRTGCARDAVQLRDRIKAKIAQHRLDAATVWGSDPDDVTRNTQRVET